MMAYRVLCRSVGAQILISATYGSRHRLISAGAFAPKTWLFPGDRLGRPGAIYEFITRNWYYLLRQQQMGPRCTKRRFRWKFLWEKM